MRALKFTCFLFSLIAFMSCKKDNNRDTTPDGNYIDKIYSLVDNGTGIDTLIALSVNYDNLKRVTLMTNGTDENWTYFYNGNDMSPYKAVIQSYGGGPDTVYFTYNSAGLKIKDSVLQGPNPASISTVTEYSYETGKIISYAVNNISNFSKDTATTDANGNILSNWLHRYYTPPVTEYYTVHSVFTYDNHPHPFSAPSTPA